ncbi:MAG: hypothetical protein V2A58_02995 [Planctomycetota bacterium]
MLRFLDHLVDYVTSVSSPGAYGELARAALPSSPHAACAILPLDEDASALPLRRLSFRLLVRDSSTAAAAARAQALHSLFARTWVSSPAFAGYFACSSFPKRADLKAELPILQADYLFHTVSVTP